MYCFRSSYFMVNKDNCVYIKLKFDLYEIYFKDLCELYLLI